jgi:hypothetical protein
MLDDETCILSILERPIVTISYTANASGLLEELLLFETKKTLTLSLALVLLSYGFLFVSLIY